MFGLVHIYQGSYLPVYESVSCLVVSNCLQSHGL